MLTTDIPNRTEIEDLLRWRRPASVSIYVPTGTTHLDVDANRLRLRSAVDTAADQLQAAGHDTREIEDLEELANGLLDDARFWQHQANSLAVFLTPQTMVTFRLPNNLPEAVEVSDRFYVKPLLRATTFPHDAFILALAQGSVRLVEVTADLPPVVVDDPDLPDDAADAVGLPSIAGRTRRGRIEGSEGQKTRMMQYSRAVDTALRPVLTGRSQPLILAATEPIASIFRSVNTYPHLLVDGIDQNPENASDLELAERARPILDAYYADQLAEVRATLDARTAAGRVATDLTDIARAATYGAVEFLLIDIEQQVPGRVDEASGAVTFDDAEDAANYGVVDEIAGRALLSGGTVYAVRASDIPDGRPAVAALRYPV